MTKLFVLAVDFCRRFAALVVVAFLAVMLGLGAYVVENLSINTDIDGLMDAELVWRVQERELAQAFPQNKDRLVVVVDGADADKAERAAALLAAEMEKHVNVFARVSRPDTHAYFLKNGLLFLSEKELEETLETLVKAQPMLGSLAADPSLRGLFSTLSLAASGIARGDADGAELAPAFALMAKTVEDALAGRKGFLPWRSMLSGKHPSLREIRKYIVAQPVLDFGALAPGAKASALVRQIANDEGLTPEQGVRVRLTGSVALNDEEFSSVAQGAELATIVSFGLVGLLLFLALRSFRLIVPILLTLVAGLVATTAFALMAVGSLNLISVAFAAMFIGVAVDFGIQFGVRYREERYLSAAPEEALRATARALAMPLSLAAATTIVGFASFVPTAYRGVAELGLIAGAGMAIALFLNVTLLPALLALTRPPAEKASVGCSWAKPLDDFLTVHADRLRLALALTACAGLVLAAQTRFDFDPLNLKDPKSESVATLFDIMKDPDATPYTIQILAPSLDAAQELSSRLEKLKEVRQIVSLASFVPTGQDAKLSLIADAKFVLDQSLSPLDVKRAPSAEDVKTALSDTIRALDGIKEKTPEAAALAEALRKVLSAQEPVVFERLDAALVEGARTYLTLARTLTTGAAARLEDIDEALRREWIAQDGRARIEVYPKGDARDPAVLAAFTKAVRALAPEATGAPIAIQESGKTIMGAFIQAGVFSLLGIGVLLLLVLRKPGDVLRVLAPLFLAGILTLATMVALDMPLNFANVIALPLLLSLGVSYAVYFVTYWRNGGEKPLASAMARAVLFSAATTLVAFFSLSLSAHMGTRGMGQLLTIALLYCLSCTFLLPVLLGRREAVRSAQRRS